MYISKDKYNFIFPVETVRDIYIQHCNSSDNIH